jgi:hypothetical protein
LNITQVALFSSAKLVYDFADLIDVLPHDRLYINDLTPSRKVRPSKLGSGEAAKSRGVEKANTRRSEAGRGYQLFVPSALRFLCNLGVLSEASVKNNWT